MTIKLIDVSKKAGVSTATVSRVLNGSSLVVPETRDRVMKVVKELGYEPSHAARMLATQKTETIGAVFPYFDSGFFADLLRGVDDEARRHGFHLITSFTHGADDSIQQISSLGFGKRVDALVLLNLDIPNSFIEELSGMKIPVVLMDRPSPDKKLSSVTLDNTSPTRELSNHLINAHQCSSFLILAGTRGTHDAEERTEACLQVMKENGIAENNIEMLHGDFTEERALELMESWAAGVKTSDALPDAIIAQNDTMALAAMEVLKKHGYSVPEDVRIVGFDDIKTSRYIGLASVQLDMFEMGKKAAEVVIAQLNEGTPVTQVVQPGHFIPRHSCGCS